MSLDDKTKQLLEKARAGDQQAFGQLILSHEKIVYNLAYRMFQNQEDSKDIAQEVFLKVYRNLDKFDGKSSFSTWIYRIASNACIDELRKRKGKETVSIDEELETKEGSMKKQIADTSCTPENTYLKKEEQQVLMEAINLLCEEHKQIITLRDFEGFSYGEIAEITNISMGTVKSRLARARNQLKNNLLNHREHFLFSSRHKDKKGGGTL